jgi:hypothetical protein
LLRHCRCLGWRFIDKREVRDANPEALHVVSGDVEIDLGAVLC